VEAGAIGWQDSWQNLQPSGPGYDLKSSLLEFVGAEQTAHIFNTLFDCKKWNLMTEHEAVGIIGVHWIGMFTGNPTMCEVSKVTSPHVL
jgi:hypothetical protein